MSNESVLQCYNLGCGKEYVKHLNTETSCCHHPGTPFFHDVYKGWSCCNKKCIDFTEFLSIKGCTLGKHNNEKPEKPVATINSQVYNTPVITSTCQVEAQCEKFHQTRPNYNIAMITLKPQISSSLQQLSTETIQNKDSKYVRNIANNTVPIGTPCQHNGCNTTYGTNSNAPCIFHIGEAIFHEGMKYWSCCKKRTTDFTVFLNQIGCQKGEHCWYSQQRETANCRWDYHQTNDYIVVSIYAKEYCTQASTVQLNPIRMYVNLIFPTRQNATFTIDGELHEIIDVQGSQLQMHATKVEIKLKKVTPSVWHRLLLPKDPTTNN